MLKDGKHCHSRHVHSARVCGEVNPLRWISWVSYENFYLAVREVFELAECCLLEGMA
jgi:hypothetical protein